MLVKRIVACTHNPNPNLSLALNPILTLAPNPILTLAPNPILTLTYP